MKSMNKPSYKEEYGEAVDMPINAFLYELTQGKTIMPANKMAEQNYSRN